MNERKQSLMVSIAALGILVSGVCASADADARESRMGVPQASRSFQRQGVAAAGSLGARAPAGAAATSTQADRAAAAETRSANQAQQQATSSFNQSQRQQASNENVETRQNAATARQQARAAYPPAYRPPVVGYYPPLGYYEQDDDWDAGSAVVGFVAGAVVGAVVTDAAHSSAQASSAPESSAPASAPQATATAAPAGLPCVPVVSTVNSVTYYQCGQSYYTQAYGPSGPFYMQVQPPAK